MTRESLIDFSLYEIKTDGNVFSKHLGKFLKNSTNENGYIRNNYKCSDNVIRPFYRERVIYHYFNGEIAEGLVIDHINGNQLDNSITNLRAITQLENTHNDITFARWRVKNIPPKHNKPHTEEAKKKMSDALKGRKFSKEQIKNMSERCSGSGNPFAGKHHTDETILKRSSPVYVLDKNYAIIAEFISINKCEQAGYSHVSEKCKGKRKDPNGLIFCFKKDYEKMLAEQPC